MNAVLVRSCLNGFKETVGTVCVCAYSSAHSLAHSLQKNKLSSMTKVEFAKAVLTKFELRREGSGKITDTGILCKISCVTEVLLELLCSK